MADTRFNINSNEYLPLRDVVFNTLRDAILTGKLVPGERLMENQLAEKLGVSRTPVREALRMLELENLVELVPRKGAQVLDMSEKDIINILEVRGVLEGLATGLACKKMGAEGLAELKSLEERFEKAISEKALEEIAEIDEQFHNVIFASTDNDKLIQIFNNLQIQLYCYRGTSQRHHPCHRKPRRGRRYNYGTGSCKIPHRIHSACCSQQRNKVRKYKRPDKSNFRLRKH